MGRAVFDKFHEAIIETVEPRRTKKSAKAIDAATTTMTVQIAVR